MHNMVKVLYIMFAIVVLPILCSSQSLTWKNISGVPGCFTVRKGVPGKLFTAYDGSTDNAGKVFRSTDNGISWTETSMNTGFIAELTANGPYTAVFKFAFGQRLFYQIWASTDHGSNWTRLIGTEFPTFANVMISDSGTVYAFDAPFFNGLQSFNLYRLGAQRWYVVGNPLTIGGGRDFLNVSTIDHLNNFYAGSRSHGVFISTDRGTTWTKSLSPHNISAINPYVPGMLVVGADSSGGINGGVYLSTNNGGSWTLLGLTSATIGQIEVDSSNNIYVATTKGLYKYGGRPNVWNYLGSLPIQTDGVVNVGSNKLVVASTTKGIYRTTDDGLTWYQNAVRGQDVSVLLSTEIGGIFAGTYGNRMFISKNNGSVWSQLNVGAICDYIFSVVNIDSLFYSGTECGVELSPDQGYTWVNVSSSYFSGGAYALTVDGSGAVYAGSNFGVYKSSDRGTTWTNTGLNTSKIISLASNNSLLVAGTAVDGIYISTDNGTTWTSKGLFRDDIQSIAVNITGIIGVGVNGGIFRSSDSGSSWEFKSILVNPGYVYVLAPIGTINFAAGTTEGVYLSSDVGTTWKNSSQGIIQSVILSLTADPTGYLLAGASQGGIYRSTQALTSIDISEQVPTVFRLYQNYPNPFNPATEIRYEISDESYVVLKVYDILGQAIATLVNERNMPGRYTTSWNASSFSSGVYFYKIQVDPISSHQGHHLIDIKKMLLVH